ncbi:helix-turn-helix domain-containing protein [Bremerella cremea]|uniref:PTS fructose transporter subunit IIA n=1 Tax=Blastopirellula marina TaxID=124 RepID=A0A2S8FZN6_9BACT|nr:MULTISPECIES: PTS sugar transporter subunit IIA [Pirellulaceae]PQO37646.1 PTS fructose transporter subunit IIA [Blastopirellula marina]RCS50033.1 helix-turn-helix domain-containing protein [Bremerella cremea]
MPSQDFDLDELAAYLHLNPSQVEKLAGRDDIPGRKVAGKWKFSRAEIHHWLEHRIGVFDEQELVRVEGVLDRHGKHEEPVVIGDMLHENTIKIPLTSRSPRKVVTEICELGTAAGYLWDAPQMIEAVLTRENMHSTALDNGVALLHPRRPMPTILAEGFLAMGRTYQGIPFGGSRGILTDVFFLICSIDDPSHLRTLARLSRIINDNKLLSAIREADHGDDVLQLIRDREDEL